MNYGEDILNYLLKYAKTIDNAKSAKDIMIDLKIPEQAFYTHIRKIEKYEEIETGKFIKAEGKGCKKLKMWWSK